MVISDILDTLWIEILSIIKYLPVILCLSKVFIASIISCNQCSLCASTSSETYYHLFFSFLLSKPWLMTCQINGTFFVNCLSDCDSSFTWQKVRYCRFTLLWSTKAASDVHIDPCFNYDNHCFNPFFHLLSSLVFVFLISNPIELFSYQSSFLMFWE